MRLCLLLPLLLSLAPFPALSAGYFTPGLPGAGDFPNTLPLTGKERIPADTGLPEGVQPQSEAITTQQLAQYAFGAATTFNMVSFGAKCDGISDDTAAFNLAIATLGASLTPVTLNFPGTCLVTYSGQVVISGALNFSGMNGGGIKLMPANAALTTQFLHWTEASGNPLVTDWTLDFNGASAATGLKTGGLYFDLGQFPTVANSRLINAGTVASGASIMMIGAYGIVSGNFSDNYCSMNATQSNPNECINLGNVNHPTSGLQIVNNRAVNTGFGIYYSDNVGIINNECDGWGFGACITYEEVGHTDTTLKHAVVANNRAINSALVRDANGVYINGIEIGYYGVNVTGNYTYGTCGPGISIYGRVSLTDNLMIDPGTCNQSDHFNAAIVAQGGLAEPNVSSFSYINGNTAYNDSATNPNNGLPLGNMSYGYSDASPNVVGVEFGVNSFSGNVGTYDVHGNVQFDAAQADNRVVNPCFAVDQRLEHGAASGTFIADQWQVVAHDGYTSLGYQTSGVARFGQCQGELVATVNVSSATVSTFSYAFFQNIGVNDVRDLAWGSLYPTNVIVSFCAALSTFGPHTFSWALLNANATETYSHLYTITRLDDSRQCFATKVPAGTFLGTTGTNDALRLYFNTGSGSTKLVAPGAWTSGNFLGAIGDEGFITLPNGTTLTISEVRVVAADSDEGWIPRNYSTELENSQRFFFKTFAQGTKPATGVTANQYCTNSSGENIEFKKSMWNTPITVTTFNPVNANANWYDSTASADVTVSVPAGGAGTQRALIASSGATAGHLMCIQATAAATGP